MIQPTVWAGMKDNVNISPEKILKIIQVHFEIKPELMFQKTRKQEIVKARKIALYLIKYFGRDKYTLEELAKLAGYKSHANVLLHIRKVKNNIQIYHEWATLIDELKNKCINYLEATSNDDMRRETVSDAVNNPEILERYFNKKGS